MPISRRHFLHCSALAAAGAMTTGLGGLFGCAARRKVPAIPRDPSRRVLADIHAHVELVPWLQRSPLWIDSPAGLNTVAGRINQTSVDWERCHEAGVDLICVAHYNPFDEWASMPTDPHPAAPANSLLMLDLLEEKLAGPAAPFARLAHNHVEAETILGVRAPAPEYRIAAVHALEGGHALGGSLDPLVDFAARGVAWITITHFFNKGIATAANAFPFFPDAGGLHPEQGLSSFGAEVVAEMESLGIVVDVTHCTATAMNDVLRVSKKPLAVTHATARTLGEHPYSLYDEHILEVVRRGGIIGVVLYPFLLSNYQNLPTVERYGSLDDVVRTVRHITKICGTHKHIGIGSDFSGFITAPKDMDKLSDIDQLRQLLLREFGDEGIVEDILANNVIDFLMGNWRSGLAQS